MVSWKSAFFVLCAFTLMETAWFLYRAVDFGVTYTYMSEGYMSCTQDLDVLERLAAVTGNKRSRKEVLALLRQQNPSAFIVEERRMIGIGGLHFTFAKNGELVEVRGANKMDLKGKQP